MKEQSEKIELLATALSKVQQEELFALTDKKNPFFKSKYADLSSVWSVARKPLTENGLSVVQTMDVGGNGDPVIVTTLFHNSGQWIKGRLEMPAPKKDPQSFGAAITYGRRYSLAAILGVCPEDDDAESAMRRGNGGKKTTPKPKQKPAAQPQQPETGNDDANRATAPQYKKMYAMMKEKNFDDDSVDLKKIMSQIFDNFEKAVNSFVDWKIGNSDNEPPQEPPGGIDPDDMSYPFDR
jgi:hypothetical protein